MNGDCDCEKLCTSERSFTMKSYTEKRVVQRMQNIGKYNFKMKSLESLAGCWGVLDQQEVLQLYIEFNYQNSSK